MTKTLLQLNTSIYSGAGQSTRLADEFVTGWLARNPGATLTVRDLARDPAPHITAERFSRQPRPRSSKRWSRIPMPSSTSSSGPT
jgi:FMN-dependent NADH-azoreductase